MTHKCPDVEQTVDRLILACSSVPNVLAAMTLYRPRECQAGLPTIEGRLVRLASAAPASSVAPHIKWESEHDEMAGQYGKVVSVCSCALTVVFVNENTGRTLQMSVARDWISFVHESKIGQRMCDAIERADATAFTETATKLMPLLKQQTSTSAPIGSLVATECGFVIAGPCSRAGLLAFRCDTRGLCFVPESLIHSPSDETLALVPLADRMRATEMYWLMTQTYQLHCAKSSRGVLGLAIAPPPQFPCRSSADSAQTTATAK